MVDINSSPLTVAIIVLCTLVVIVAIVITCFLVIRHRRLASTARGLKPFVLSSSRNASSIKKGKRDSKEKERGSKKVYPYDDDELFELGDDGKEEPEPFEHGYSAGAVGTGATPRQPPQRSQTMWGTSLPSTVELSVGHDELSVGQPVLQQQTHFMSSGDYPDDDNKPGQM